MVTGTMAASSARMGASSARKPDPSLKRRAVKNLLREIGPGIGLPFGEGSMGSEAERKRHRRQADKNRDRPCAHQRLHRCITVQYHHSSAPPKSKCREPIAAPCGGGRAPALDLWGPRFKLTGN